MRGDEVKVRDEGERVSVVLTGGQLPHLREMVRQQLLGDIEMMRDCVAGREDPELRLGLADRMDFLRALAPQIGLAVSPDRCRETIGLRPGIVPRQPPWWKRSMARHLLS